MARNGIPIKLLPSLNDEIDKIRSEHNLSGRNSKVFAQEKAVEYIKIGREIDRMYKRVTLMDLILPKKGNR